MLKFKRTSYQELCCMAVRAAVEKLLSNLSSKRFRNVAAHEASVAKC